MGSRGHSARPNLLNQPLLVSDLRRSCRQPIVTGTSVLGLKFKGGVILAADMLGASCPQPNQVTRRSDTAVQHRMAPWRASRISNAFLRSANTPSSALEATCPTSNTSNACSDPS